LTSVNLPSQRRRQSGAHVARQVKVHQPVGGTDLNFGVRIPGRFDQSVEAVPGADLDDGFDRFEPHFIDRVLKQPSELGNR